MHVLSVIIPVLNERGTIETIIEKIDAVPLDTEIIIVDDGSTDGTRDILEKLGRSRPDIKIVYHDRKRGKGRAIRTALAEVSGDLVIIQDADLEYEPADYVKLVNKLDEHRADVVYGSRYLGRNEKSYLRFYFGGRLLSFLTNILYGTHITDEPTCYKLFRTDILRGMDLQCEGFEFCPEVTAKALLRGYTIAEVPIRYLPRNVREGKKIRWYDGLIAIIVLLKYRFLSFMGRLRR